MNTSQLGAECYHKFKVQRVINRLSKIPDLPDFWSLCVKDPQEAANRGAKRLADYYEHLRELLTAFGGHLPPNMISILDEVESKDRELLHGLYAAAANEPPNEPGIALFLRIGKRSVAFLPSNDEPRIYMSSAWRNALGKFTLPIDWQTRILRSNILWARERSWVLPASDTVEAFGDENELPMLFFKNISRHKKRTDGWIHSGAYSREFVYPFH